MARHVARLPDLVILNTAQESNVVSTPEGLGYAVDLILFTDDVAANVLVGYDDEQAFASLLPLYINGADVTAPPSKAFLIPTSSFRSIALSTAAPVGADKTYRLVAQMEMM